VHWIDEDGDCQNARAEVLIVESRQPVSPAGGCTVTSGDRFDPYSWTLASDRDVDHVVALQNSHLSGGYAWGAAKKQAYANDMSEPDQLIAVEGQSPPEQGRVRSGHLAAPRFAYWCTYAIDWSETKKRRELTVTPSEYDALAEMLATC
jgi:hypothetical protein